jgi:hypothetical protein
MTYLFYNVIALFRRWYICKSCAKKRYGRWKQTVAVTKQRQESWRVFARRREVVSLNETAHTIHFNKLHQLLST